MNSTLKDRLELGHAIVQAPMAGGPTTAELVSAVSSAGALGSFGFAYSTPEQIHTQCQSMQQIDSSCLWNANFFVFPTTSALQENDLNSARKSLQPLCQRVGVDAESLNASASLPVLSQQLEAALEYQPRLVSFHLGIPSADILDTVRSTNAAIALSATSVTEALQCQRAGADFIVAQGIEAGGHRGIFEPSNQDEKLTTMELARQLSAQCSVPIIAAGGIMNGSDIVAAQRAGADAVQMGSAFLTVDEAGTSAVYRSAIKQLDNRDTTITHGFSGRPARGIQNLFTDTTEQASVLAFPHQNALTASLRKAAADNSDYELLSLWAGSAYHKARHCSAGQLIEQLQSEITQALNV